MTNDPFANATHFVPPSLPQLPINGDQSEKMPASPSEDECLNSLVISALEREINGPLYDAHAIATAVEKRNQERSWRDAKASVLAAQNAARSRSRTEDWSGLDMLALRRCALWVAHADAFGRGVTEDEASDIMSRDSLRIKRASRNIIARLVDEVPPPDVDGELVAEALDLLVPGLRPRRE